MPFLVRVFMPWFVSTCPGSCPQEPIIQRYQSVEFLVGPEDTRHGRFVNKQNEYSSDPKGVTHL